MKNTKFAVKSLLAFGALFAFAAPTFAQTPVTPVPATPTAPAAPVRGVKHAARLPKWLAEAGLTPEQTTKVHEILKANAAQTAAVRTDATLSDAQKKAKLKELKKDNRTEIMALLTPEQKAKVLAEKKGPAPVAPAPPAAPAPVKN